MADSDYAIVQDGQISAVNEPAPDFRLPATDGTELGLADFRGQPVLLFFYRGQW